MDINYQTDLHDISSEQLADFCVGWKYPICGNDLHRILENSYRVVFAKQRETVAGFVNSLSDGLKFAFIPMLEVLPAYKNNGIGTKLLNILFEELAGIPNIDLTCD